MFRQLSKIRSLVTEIEDIQKNGQFGRNPRAAPAQMTFDPIPEAPRPVAPKPVLAPTPTAIAAPVAPVLPSMDSGVGATSAKAPPKKVVSQAELGKVDIRLTGNVFIQLQLDNSDEILEIRHFPGFIEIRFADGKAVHLPLATVA